MQKLLNKLHFGHSLLAGGVITGLSTAAFMMGHIDGTGMLRVIFAVIGMLVLSVLFAKFK